jgi:type I restriction enzyme R subunit
MNTYTEDALVEQPAIALFQELGWQYLNCYYERFGPDGTLGRETSQEVVLVPRLRDALRRTRDLLLPKLISGEVEVDMLPEGITDTQQPGEPHGSC